MNSNEGLKKQKPMCSASYHQCFCGAFKFWQDPSEDIYTEKDGKPIKRTRATPSNESSGATTADVISVHEGTKWYRGECCSGYPNCIHRPPNRGFIAPTKTMGGDEEIYQKYPDEIREIEEIILKNCSVRNGLILWAQLSAMLIIKAGFHRDVPSLKQNKEELKNLFGIFQLTDDRNRPNTGIPDWNYDDLIDAIIAKFSKPAVPDVGGLVEALEYCKWKLEQTYKYIHQGYELKPDGSRWHTKESYRSTEEGKQFARAIDKAEQALTAFRTAQKGTNDTRRS